MKHIKQVKRVKIDVAIKSTGSNFVLVRPLSAAAGSWLDDHVAGEATWWAGALVVEHRYLDDLIEGMRGDGLAVSAG